MEKETISPHKHLFIMAGNLPDANKVWDISLEVINALGSVTKLSSLDTYLNVCPHPNIDYLKSVKDLGIKSVQYNLELIDSDSFAEYCPGKLKHELFKKKLLEAVSIMGIGQVRSNFVFGLEPFEPFVDGISELAKNGIVPDYSVFQPKRGTKLEKRSTPNLWITSSSSQGC